MTRKAIELILKLRIPFLSIILIWTYLDRDLPNLVSSDGVWKSGWSQQTEWATKIIPIELFSLDGTYFLIILACIASIMINSKRSLTLACFMLFAIQALFSLRNPSWNLIHRPYIGFLLLILPLIQNHPKLRVLHHSAFDILWQVTSISFFISGLSKLLEGHWIQGRGLADLVGFPIVSPIFKFMMLHEPFMIFLNYFIIFIEVFGGIAGLFCSLRKFVLIGFLLLQIGICAFLWIHVVSIPMIVFLLFLIDNKWVRLTDQPVASNLEEL